MWLKFQAVLQSCPTHGMTDNVLLESFYRGLGPDNRSNVDQLFAGGGSVESDRQVHIRELQPLSANPRKKPDIAERTRRLAERPLVHPLSAPLYPLRTTLGKSPKRLRVSPTGSAEFFCS
uniref:Integrase core domain containing protein n=1 Tax=Solanum tuberosum TaxID=4113 RepID=M1DQ83_SOLTU